MATVRLEGITRKFSNSYAIENISFAVPDGEFWVLVGPSGCGKSTILRTIAGLEPVIEGKIYIGETLVNQVPARLRDVAMVFQNYSLYPHMTVAENLSFGLKMRKLDSSTINKRIVSVAEILNIQHLLQRKPKQLSGGQQQRVALGRAIARQPQVFLLDEPLSNLDAQLRDSTRTELKLLHQQVGITTIYVTHDQVEAMTLADQIVVLHQGRIQQIDTPQAIYAQPVNQMVASFLGSPPMNILPATYLNGGFAIDNQFIPITSKIKEQLHPQERQAFILGIRPEHITIASNESKNQLSVKIDVIEPLGRETLIKATLVGTQLNLNLTMPFSWHGNQENHLHIQLDINQLFIFDPISGETIYPIFQ